MQVRLLGPVDVALAGTSRRGAGLRRKAVLAVLGLPPATRRAPTGSIDVVWGGRPPATALNTLQRHVSYLRGVLGAGVDRAPGRRVPAGGVEDTDVVARDAADRAGTGQRDPAWSA